MSQATDALKNAWRDNVTVGIPGTGPNEPDKRDIRAGLDALSSELATIGSGLLRYATKAAMDADTSKPAGSLAYVYANNGNPSDAANGFYQWSGSAWVSAPWYLAGTGIDALLTSQIDTIRVGSGEKLLETSVLTGTSGGAVPIVVGGRTIGFTIPTGQTGAGSNVILRIPFSYEEAQRLAGSTIRLRVVMEATAGYLAATPFGGNAVRVDRQNGTTDMNVGTALVASQSGTRLTRDYTYTMVGDELLVGATVQIGVNAPTDAVRSFQVKSIVWDVIATPADAASTGADAALDLRLAAMEPAADIFGKVEPVFQLFNGAVSAQDDGGRTAGVTIPAGQSGQNTIMQWRLPMTGRLRKMLPGKQARITLGFNTPTAWARTHTVNMQVRDVNLAVTAIVATQVIDKQISPTRRVISFNFLAPTGAVLDDLRPYIQLTDASAASADEAITLTDMVMSYYRNGSDVMQEAASTALLGDEFTRGASVEQAVGTVFATGKRLGALLDAASYASIALALQTATALASPGAMAQVNVGEGVFTERSLGLIGSGTDGDNIILRGAGKGRTIIDARLPETTPIATIQATSGLDFNRTQEVSDLTSWVANMRYGAHIDSVNFAPDSRNVWRNVDIVHFGNDAADAYWGQSVWASQHAWALGTTSGSYYGFDNCGGRAPRAAFSAHDNYDTGKAKGFTSPSIVEWAGGALTATNVAGWSFRLESIGSMVMNRALLTNATLSGDISMAVQPWLPTALSQQPADHRCWELTGSGNSPAVFRIEDFGRALRITSATSGVNSKVVLSGTAAPILFGKTGTAGVTQVDGDVGMAGYAYGWADVSSDTASGRPGAITKLGARLGNRTSSPVTLTVRIDALAAINIVLNADYSAMTNAQVIAVINAALGSAGTASEYNVGARYRPVISDEEKSLQNTSGTTIFMGMALAHDSNGSRTVRPMQASDLPSAFVGVAWEDIRPGAFGRVKTRGWIDIGDVLRSNGAGVVAGERFTIDPAKPGYVQSGALNDVGILKIIRRIAGQNLTTLLVEPGRDLVTGNDQTAIEQVALDEAGNVSTTQLQLDATRQVIMRRGPVLDYVSGETLAETTARFNYLLAAIGEWGGGRVKRGEYALGRLALDANVELELDQDAVLDFSGATTAGHCLSLGNTTFVDLPALTADLVEGTYTATFASAPDVAKGDWIIVHDPTPYGWLAEANGGRTYYQPGERLRVADVVGPVVTFDAPILHSYAYAGLKMLKPAVRRIHLAGGHFVGRVEESADNSLIVAQNIQNGYFSFLAKTAERAILDLRHAIDTDVVGVAATDYGPSVSLNYGISVMASHKVNIIRPKLRTRRHAVSITGGSILAPIPNRYVYVKDAFLSGDSLAFDSHGAAEFIGIIDSTIEGGAVLGGDHTDIKGCLIRTLRAGTNAGVGISLRERRGMNVNIDKTDVYTATALAADQYVIDMAGPAAAQESGAVRMNARIVTQLAQQRLVRVMGGAAIGKYLDVAVKVHVDAPTGTPDGQCYFDTSTAVQAWRNAEVDLSGAIQLAATNPLNATALKHLSKIRTSSTAAQAINRAQEITFERGATITIPQTLLSMQAGSRLDMNGGKTLFSYSDLSNATNFLANDVSNGTVEIAEGCNIHRLFRFDAAGAKMRDVIVRSVVPIENGNDNQDAAIRVYGDDFSARNITLENLAITFRITGKNASLENVTFKGCARGISAPPGTWTGTLYAKNIRWFGCNGFATTDPGFNAFGGNFMRAHVDGFYIGPSEDLTTWTRGVGEHGVYFPGPGKLPKVAFIWATDGCAARVSAASRSRIIRPVMPSKSTSAARPGVIALV